MPRHRKPAYSLHKAKNLAYVRIDGRQIYLGEYGSPESRDRYDDLIAEWIADNSEAIDRYQMTVDELVLLYIKHAESYYVKARKSMREGDFHTAIQYGKLAISYVSEDPRYYALLADCQIRNPEAKWQRLAEQNYLKATELDPWNPEHWLRLGQFYKQRGLTIRAKKQIRKALEVAPGFEEAVAELKQLG